MIRWAVTGPAGAGKSALCDLLARRGAAIVDADRLGHDILAREEIISNITAEFGSGVVSEGSVDRAALGCLVFADPVALEKLNGITHGPLAALAGRKLDELEKEGRIELVITVTASVSVRLLRMTDDGVLSPGEARSRIEAQRFLEDGWARADVVLTNDGPVSELETAATALWARLED